MSDSDADDFVFASRDADAALGEIHRLSGLRYDAQKLARLVPQRLVHHVLVRPHRVRQEVRRLGRLLQVLFRDLAQAGVVERHDVPGDGDLVVDVAERAVDPVVVLAARVRGPEAGRGVRGEDGHVLEHRGPGRLGEQRGHLLAEARARRVVPLGDAANLGPERVEERGAVALAAVLRARALQQRLLDGVDIVVSPPVVSLRVVVADAPTRQQLRLDRLLQGVVVNDILLVAVNLLLLEVTTEPHGRPRPLPRVRSSTGVGAVVTLE